MIPIVLATDKNYLSQTYVTILSALENKEIDTLYDIYILIPKSFSFFNTIKFKNLIKKYKGCKIHFITMRNAFASKKMQISHITSPTYYRLKIAEILPQYQRAIYMDSDVIVLKDLNEYFNSDLGGNYIGGVKAAGYILHPDGNKKLCEKLGIKDISQYINAGITLWNLEQIRRDNMQDKLMKLSENDYPSMDQDIINIAFYNHILHFPYKYNMMTTYKTRYLDNPEKLPDFYSLYGKENIEEALKSPVIIHYADKIKPWNSEVWLGKYWKKYADITPYTFGERIPFIQHLFSVKNDNVPKVLCILGIRIKLKKGLLLEPIIRFIQAFNLIGGGGNPSQSKRFSLKQRRKSNILVTKKRR